MNLDTLLSGITIGGMGGLSLYLSTVAARAALPAMRDLNARFALPQALVPHQVPKRRWLESRCLCVDKGAIRQTDGAFVAAFKIHPTESYLAHDEVVADFHRKVTTWLTNDAPVGTTFQFRQSVRLEDAESLKNQGSRLGESENTFKELHLNNLLFLADKIGTGQFRKSFYTLWVRVPTTTLQPGLKLAASEMALQLKMLLSGKWRLDPKSIIDSVQESNLVRRMEREEKAARKIAEDVFQQIVRTSPFGIERMNSKDLWKALFFSHNETAASCTRLPGPLVDIGQYLSDEAVVFGNDAILHGDTPVGIVSLTTPPQSSGDGLKSGSFPGVMRQITANPTLNFRHTIVTEFEKVDQGERRKRYDRSIEWTKRLGANLFGGGTTKEANQRLMELDALRGDMATGQTNIMAVRLQVLVYGDPLDPTAVENFKETKKLSDSAGSALDQKTKSILNALRDIPGVNAIRENRAAASCLYPGLIAGESGAGKSGREIEEVSQSVTTFVSCETGWSLSQTPSTFFRGLSGELVGIDLFEAGSSRPPATAILGQTGSGKSVLAGALGLDTLATHPNSQVQIVDFNSFKTFAEVTGGTLFQFHPSNKKGFNIGFYEGLHEGMPVAEEQVTLVLGDLKILAGLDVRETIFNGLLEPVIREVYVAACAYNRNRRGTDVPPQEPTLSSFLETLDYWCRGGAFRTPEHNARAADILLRLERFRENPWLDRPMDPEYVKAGRLIVYDMESLGLFNEEIRRSLAYRVAARTTQVMNVQEDDQRPPRLNIFDEMARISHDYPEILYAIEKGAFQGRKSNVQTLLIAQTYQQVESLENIVQHVGLKIIGRQNGDYRRMIEDFHISEDAAAAIENITNQPGSHAQFVMCMGEGISHRADFIQFELSSFYLWIFTTEPNEVTELRRVGKMLRDPVKTILFLASRYPRGLAFSKKTSLTDEDFSALKAYQERG